jgi:putative ABC transport system permease protein
VAAAARRAVGTDGTVLSGGARDRLEPESVTRIRWLGAQLLIAMVALGLFVAVFVVAATCALSAAQRRREVGLLRAVGATPGQVRRLMYAETLVVAVAAGLAGQPLVWAASFALGIVVALAGVWSSARRSSRVPALDALREAAVERRAMTAARWVLGLLGTAAGLALLAALPVLPVDARSTAGLGAAMLLLTAAALLAPVAIVPLVRALTWPWRTAATGMLVREGTLTGVRRVATTAAPVLLAVGFTVLLTGTVATIGNVTGPSEAAKIPAAMVAAPLGTPGLSDAAVRAQPGVSRLPTRVLVTRGGVTTGYDASGVSDAPGLVLDAATAKALQADKGTVLPVRFADGAAAALPVAGVTGDEPVELPREVVRAHDPTALTASVLLRGPAAPAPGLRAMTARAYVQEDVDSEGRLIDLFLWVLIGLAVGYTGLAVANTLLMATAARRPEFRALRLAGAATAQVLRVTTAEALLAVLTGTLLGGAVAAISLIGVKHAVEAELSMPVPIVIPWGPSATVTTACALVALLATALPVLRR